MSSICPQPLCFPLDGTSSFPAGEMCDRIELTPVHWWRETIDCQVSGPIHAIPAIHFHQACQEADGIFSIGLPHIICSKYESCHQNVTARIKKGEQAGDWVVARTHFWKSPDNKRRPTFLLSNFSSCEIHCWPRSVILPHYMHLSSIWAFEDLEQMHSINLCWCKLKQSQCTAVARPTRFPN